MKNNAQSAAFNRRSALRVIGSSLAASVAITQTRPTWAEEKNAVDCTTGKIDKGSKQMRMALQYVEASKKKGQECIGCLQWIPAEEGKSCGGCKLFSGPVNPKGYCLSFAPTKKK